MKLPKDLKYTATHEWIRLEGDVGIVGITDYAQEHLGDVVFVDLPQKGTQGSKGVTFGSIESVKAVSDLFYPVTGEVVEANADLKDAPQLVNEDCYVKGWMIKIKIKNPSEVSALMDADGYQNMPKE